MEKLKEIYLKKKLPIASECFYGRDEEIEKIHQNFQKGEKVIFLQGIGGIGKTEIAKVYAAKYQKEYEVVVFAHCISDLRSLVSNDEEISIAHVKRKVLEDDTLEDEDDYFERKIKILKQITSDKVLIIVDNFNNRQDINLREFLSGEYKVIFTTRANWEHTRYPVIRIEEIKDIDAIKKIIYAYYNQQDSKEDAAIIEMIQLVYKHTLVVEWLAKQMADGSITPTQMLERLKSNGLLLDGTTFTKNEIMDTEFTNQHILYQQLCNVFDVSVLAEEEKEVLMYMTLVPYTGISKEQLVKRGKRGCHSALLKLMRNSWIKQTDVDLISLHPVIADIVFRVLKPDWHKCKTFIESIQTDLKNPNTSNKTISELMPIVEAIIDKLGLGTTESVDFLLASAQVFEAKYKNLDMAEGVAEKALKVAREIVSRLNHRLYAYKDEDIFNIAYNELKSDIYNAEKKVCEIIDCMAHIKYEKADYEQALHYFLQLTKEPQILDSYCDIAMVYKTRKEFEKAIEYIEIGIKYKKKKYGKNTTKIVENYIKLAEIYMDMEESDMSLVYMKEAKELIEKENHPLEMAQFYFQLAYLLKQMCEYEKALMYDKKAYEIRSQELGEASMEVIKSYAAMAVDYYNLGDCVSTLKCTIKEITLRKKLNQIKLRIYKVFARLLPLVEGNKEITQDMEVQMKEINQDFQELLQNRSLEA